VGGAKRGGEGAPEDSLTVARYEFRHPKSAVISR
jgi:hypothetical protein